ncbi:MAG: type II toxin-antitoxin system RelE/ParE family toxin [Ferruginibacter sp.]|nr:type II toxin-antitoxin system RelE/ParE family toxin [Ferruginibacter sp.]
MAITRNIIWDRPARLYLRKATEYISQDSVKNADIVVNAIFTCIEKASRFPEHFPPDKYKLNNSGSYRAFEIYSYRVSFYADAETIRIVRIRHTKQKPLNY